MAAFSIFIVWGSPLIILVIWYINGISRNWDGIYFRVGGIAIGATTLPSQQKSFVRLALFEIAKSADEQQTKKC